MQKLNHDLLPGPQGGVGQPGNCPSPNFEKHFESDKKIFSC